MPSARNAVVSSFSWSVHRMRSKCTIYVSFANKLPLQTCHAMRWHRCGIVANNDLQLLSLMSHDSDFSRFKMEICFNWHEWNALGYNLMHCTCTAAHRLHGLTKAHSRYPPCDELSLAITKCAYRLNESAQHRYSVFAVHRRYLWSLKQLAHTIPSY